VALVNVSLPAGISGRLQLSERLLQRIGLWLPPTAAYTHTSTGNGTSTGTGTGTGNGNGNVRRTQAMAALVVHELFSTDMHGAHGDGNSPAGRGRRQTSVQVLPTVVVVPTDSALFDERVGGAEPQSGGRSLALVLELPERTERVSYTFAVSVPPSVGDDATALVDQPHP
jgi:hypothetical protein